MVAYKPARSTQIKLRFDPLPTAPAAPGAEAAGSTISAAASVAAIVPSAFADVEQVASHVADSTPTRQQTGPSESGQADLLALDDEQAEILEIDVDETQNAQASRRYGKGKGKDLGGAEESDSDASSEGELQRFKRRLDN